MDVDMNHDRTWTYLDTCNLDLDIGHGHGHAPTYDRLMDMDMDMDIDIGSHRHQDMDMDMNRTAPHGRNSTSTTHYGLCTRPPSRTPLPLRGEGSTHAPIGAWG
jgi:hypothetical protein